MLATLLIVFREVIEAGLIIGIVMAATRGVPYRGLWVSYGVLAGILGACLVAAFASQISTAMEGVGQELFNAGILAIAVGMLTWHNVWMARHGRDIAMHMKDVGEAVAHGRRSLMALAVVVGIAVLREGSEVVLFLYGIALSGSDSVFAMGLGGALGLLFGAALGTLTYLGLLKIPNRYLFAVTGWLIALLAAGMAAQIVAFLDQAQIVTALNETIWDSSWLLSDGSLAGKTLHTLIGYTAQPTGMQLLVYGATLIVIFSLMRLFGHMPQHKKPLHVSVTH
jgi:high-affinity iron transporter